ncbi:MAG: hypothetical protein HPY52_08280 [Firmicutes bacterium]|nr:hypothetical protein [Bacillota bacterium]
MDETEEIMGIYPKTVIGVTEHFGPRMRLPGDSEASFACQMASFGIQW